MTDKPKNFLVIECVTHGYTRWDVKEKKDAPAKLYLWCGQGFPMSPDIIWLQSITRPDSGTWFTTSIAKAMQFVNEDEADDRLTMLVLELGYLPGDLTLTKCEPQEEGEDEL